MRRVLVLNQFALPRSEPGGTRHIDLFSRLQGWEPVIMAGCRNHYSQKRFRTRDPRFTLVEVPPQRGGRLSRVLGWVSFSVQALLLGLLQRRLDLVYGSTPHLLAPLTGLLVARARRVPFVLEVRDLWPESIVAAGSLRAGGLPHRVLMVIERRLVGSADAVVVVTPGWEQHFTELGIDPSRLVVIPNGTEVSEFEIRLSRESLRSHWRIGRFTAVFAGAHGPKDGLPYILDAAARLPDIDILLAGAGPAKGLAQEQAQSRGLANIRFLDPVEKDKLPQLLAAADVGIHAVAPLEVFDKGMSPNKLFDYLAAGLPVVSNAAEALQRVVHDGECGRIGGREDLAWCLAEVAAAPEHQRQEWAARGKRIVSERFSRTAAAATLQQVLDSSVARAGESGRTP